MRKRMVSGIRDLWIVLFCLVERTLLQILLAVPVPVRMVLVGVLAAKYVECLFCTSLSMTILTVVMTVFVATNIKKWNAEFQIIYVTARLRKRSRKKAYNFRINQRIYGQPCTNMCPRLTQIWAETGTEDGSLLKEKGMTRCTERPATVTCFQKVPVRELIFQNKLRRTLRCSQRSVHRTFL